MKLKDIKAVIRVDEQGARTILNASLITNEFSCLAKRKQSLADFNLVMLRYIAANGGLDSIDLTSATQIIKTFKPGREFKDYYFGGAQ